MKLFRSYLFHCTVLVVSLLLPLSEAALAESFFLEEDFEGYASGSDGFPDWVTSGVTWEIQDGRFVSTEPSKDFAVLDKAPWSGEGEMEATLVIDEKTSSHWKVAGVGLYADGGHYWHFALVEAPDGEGGRHFIELSEMYDGQWLAQSQGRTALRSSETIFTNAGWQYGETYRLKLEWTGYGIRGSVLTSGGILIARRGYQFDRERPAVRFGKPMLVNGGFRSEFERVKVSMLAEEGSPLSQPTPFPEYDRKGYRRIRSEATGFFRTEKVDDTWWVIDPNGHGFYMVGTDHCNYNVHWCQKLGYAPYNKFISEKYESEDAWAESATDRLKSWNFNTLGANNSSSTRHRGLTHLEFLNMGTEFTRHSDICPQVHWTGLPNVFSPKFRQFCRKKAKQVCEPMKDDPWLLGYFIDNELEWYGKSHSEWGLCDEVFKKPADHEAKVALVDFLKRRHKSISGLNEAWGLALSAFDDVLSSKSVIETSTKVGIADKKEFVRIIADRYFEITTSAIREFDPNHMILGIRFAGQSPNLWDIAGKYCDVVSVNCYRHIDFKTRTFADGFEQDLALWYQSAKRPLMITEWSFPALDTPLPSVHGAGQRVPTQEYRAQAYSIFQRRVFSLPYLVGSMYFMWVDEPALGISENFPEDSNYGLVNEHDEPYTKLVGTAKRINKHVYDLHAGLTPKLRVSFAGDDKVQVQNIGNSSASTKMATTIDGKRKEYKVRVGKQSSRTVRLPKKEEPGGHFSFVEINPDGATIEPDFIGHRAERTSYIPSVEDTGAAGSPLIVINRSEYPIEEPMCMIETERLPGFDPDSPTLRIVPSEGDKAETIPYQYDNGPFQKLLAFSPQAIQAYGVETYRLIDNGKPTSIETESQSAERIVDNGVLTMRFSDHGGAVIDSIKLGDVELGEFTPLIHEQESMNYWLRPNRVEDLWIHRGPVRTVAQVLLSYDTDAAPGPNQARPRSFRTCYQFEIEPGKPYFVSRFLWLENTDREPLHLGGYFHSPYSRIRGSSEDDEVATNLFHPNLMVSAAGWKDKDICFGAIVPPENGMHMVFWKDPQGGQHPDLTKKLEVELKPGERYSEEGLPVVIFGSRHAEGVNPLQSMDISGIGNVGVYTGAELMEQRPE